MAEWSIIARGAGFSLPSKTCDRRKAQSRMIWREEVLSFPLTERMTVRASGRRRCLERKAVFRVSESLPRFWDVSPNTCEAADRRREPRFPTSARVEVEIHN